MIKLLMCLFFCVYGLAAQKEKYIEKFTDANSISQWIEHSDTVQDLGKSKGTLVLLQSSKFQRAVLFTLLNPQPCGAAFAGVRKRVNLDLKDFKHIVLKVRGQGSYHGYKLIFKESSYNYSFCNLFEVSENFQEIKLPFQEFKPYAEGKAINNTDVRLDLSKIISIGIQAYGGVYLPKKQSGVASLEIDWIKAE